MTRGKTAIESETASGLTLTCTAHRWKWGRAKRARVDGYMNKTMALYRVPWHFSMQHAADAGVPGAGAGSLSMDHHAPRAPCPLFLFLFLFAFVVVVVTLFNYSGGSSFFFFQKQTKNS